MFTDSPNGKTPGGRYRDRSRMTQADFRRSFAWVFGVLLVLVLGLGVTNQFSGGGLSVTQQQALADEAPLYYLHREASADDEIRQVDLQRSNEVTVFTASDIQEFERVGQRLVAVLAQEDHSSQVAVIDLQSREHQQITLPSQGSVRMVAGTEDADQLGLLFTAIGGTGESLIGDRVLFYDLAGELDQVPDREPRVVNNADGEPVQGVFLSVPPDTTEFVLQLFDQSVVRITQDDQLFPLGSYDYVLGFAADAPLVLTLKEYNRFGVSAELGTAEEIEVPLPAGVSEESALLELSLVTAQNRVVQLYQVATDDDVYQQLVVSDDAGVRELLRVGSEQGQILRTCMPPSGAFIAVTMLPPSPVYDDFWVNPAAVGVSTEVLDVVSGTTVATFDGFDASWCSPRTIATEAF